MRNVFLNTACVAGFCLTLHLQVFDIQGSHVSSCSALVASTTSGKVVIRSELLWRLSSHEMLFHGCTSGLLFSSCKAHSRPRQPMPQTFGSCFVCDQITHPVKGMPFRAVVTHSRGAFVVRAVAATWKTPENLQKPTTTTTTTPPDNADAHACVRIFLLAMRMLQPSIVLSF